MSCPLSMSYLCTHVHKRIHFFRLRCCFHNFMQNKHVIVILHYLNDVVARLNVQHAVT